MEKLQEITQRYRLSYKVIKDILLNPSNEIKYNDETSVQDAPFFMIKAKENIFDIMGNIQLIRDKENYSQMLDNSSINFSLDHKMFYYIFKTADVQVIMKDFIFFSLSTIFQTHITLISTAHLRIQGRIQQLKIAEDEIDEHMLKEENEEEEKLLKSIASNK